MKPYGTSTAITITLASLADSAARESTAIDNSSTLYDDIIVQVKFKLQTGTPGNAKAVMIYAAGSEDGTKWTDNATGSDAAVTMRSPTNFRTLDTVLTPDSGGLTYVSNPVGLAAFFGGVLPRKVNIVVSNLTNVTFSATAGDHAATYTGVKY